MTPASFHPAVTSWFERSFDGATAVQERAWPAIAEGSHTLITAPTGSGKTLAAFLAVIDDLVGQSLEAELRDETQVLYVSPLKALSNDIHKNLQLPLAGIRDELLESGLPDAPIRAAVRTGDTPQSQRARMRKRPPHILVTTPESLYILLTSESGRGMLGNVRTVIVDEIHAVAGNKRGAHLALSLERLSALCEREPTRVGISATSKPIESMVEFLTGVDRGECTVIDAGHSRERDLRLELPGSPLEAVMAAEVWAEIYDQLAELIAQHRTTLVFVNTRRLAERLARHLAERCGEDVVTSHHGSLAKEHRLRAEENLKAGRLKALVATGSLELGIDIGDVDLVCQLGSPRVITTFLQRVGRSGHGVDRLPKGRLFPMTRDELVECAAIMASVREGELDATQLCLGALDVLAQQIVAEVSIREWEVDALFARFCRSRPYRDLSYESFLSVVKMLADGFSTQRGRRSAYLHFDQINSILRPRRSARLTAITNGGAIPDQFDYDVVLLPSELSVGTLNEDFAFESMPGNIFQLGNMSYRVLKVTTGKVFVEDAHGQPPTIPFWFGEAPGRSDELSSAVSRLRSEVDRALAAEPAAAVAGKLSREAEIPLTAAEQLVDYLAGARAALGLLPTKQKVVFERFFDEAGDSHLVIHSPYGSRLNRAWGLALRKRFCRRFNFELQAAALEDSIVLSLGTVHSFPLEEVTRYLSSETVRDVLTQALLTAPVFPGCWRWTATIALAVRRFRNGKKAPAQFQRTDAEDLLATVFPDQLACAENLTGKREIPDHPLVAQTLADCLQDVMDIDGLEQMLKAIESGSVEVLCRELTSPSPLAQEILAAKPFAFLDDAPAEERRTLAVQTRRYMTVEQASDLGRLDPAAIARVHAEAWPEPRDAEELHDALVMLGFITAAEGERGHQDDDKSWQRWFELLEAEGRATVYRLPTGPVLWVSAERLAEIRLIAPLGEQSSTPKDLPCGCSDSEAALTAIIRSRLEGLGPVVAKTLAEPFDLEAAALEPALLALEVEGFAMRGNFSTSVDDLQVAPEQWCERRLLARIHRYTLKRLRSEIEPVTIADYQRFLFSWQGLGTERREGGEALAAILSELQGLALPAAAWERELLPSRLTDFGSDLVDQLSNAGSLVWFRPRSVVSKSAQRTRTVASSPIAIVPRSALPHWRILTDSGGDDEIELSSAAKRVKDALSSQGALFFLELVQISGLLRVQVEDALSELVAWGLVTADSFNGLRALVTPPSRRRGFRGRSRRSGPNFDAAGRWALLDVVPIDRSPEAYAESVEHAAHALLQRYGVVCRAVLARESSMPGWRELLRVFRRWEARGEIRGGRFVDALGGEQFALLDAVEALRSARRDNGRGGWVVLSAADPLNLAGVLTPGGRVAAIHSHRVVYLDGAPLASLAAGRVQWLAEASVSRRAEAERILTAPVSRHGRTRRTGRGASLSPLRPVR
ncbi:MAG: DEAD/DEAH box helicase [Candidatus Rariloculaceae bacterium]